MSESVVDTEMRGRVGIAWLNRPESGNVWGWDMCDGLEAALAEFDARADVRVIVLAGRGRHFCTGMNLNTLETLAELGHPTVAGVPADSAGRVVLRSMGLHKPLLVAMHGACIGVGTTMTLAADMRIAGESARFGLPFTRLGVTPEGISSWLLPRIVGLTRAMEWIMTGRTIDVGEAHSAGLVSRVVPDDEVFETTMSVAADIAESTAPTSVANSRQLIWRVLASNSTDEVHRLESQLLYRAVQGEDARGAVEAFLEKRPPIFEERIIDWLSPMAVPPGHQQAVDDH